MNVIDHRNQGGRQSAWDDASWRESDNRWTAGCRWLQSWWRHQQRLGPGPLTPGDARLVCSMLPTSTAQNVNFLTDAVVDAVEARLREGNHSGIIATDRLYRNLLSSQPTCFNLFGPFVKEPSQLVRWVRTLDVAVAHVDTVRFEWAPDRALHFEGGSAFDAFIDYTTRSGGRRFIAVECKYAENLASSSINVRQVYIDFTRDCGLWQPGAEDRLNQKKLRQFWLNTLLAQSLATRPPRQYESGLAIIVACAADTSARSATEDVRQELLEPDRWLHWSPYETILEHIDGHDEWKQAFTRRYLDFTPVRHLLAASDTRIVGRSSAETT